jgi:hypothetical protein
MPETRRSPTLRRRRLSTELRRLLEASGLTAVQVDKDLGWTPGKLAKMARGQWLRPNPRDIQDLLDRLLPLETECSDEERVHYREELLRWAREGREKGWWYPYREMISESYTNFIGLEDGAASVLTFELGIMPGLVQTPEYAEALLLGGPSELSSEQIAQRVEIRLERQKLLTRDDDPVRLWAVIDESVLRRPVGGPAVLKAQLAHLTELIKQPKVTVQVVPNGVGAHPGLNGPFTILEFPEPLDHDAVYTENIAGELMVEEQHDVGRFKVAFQRLTATAKSPEDSLELIDAAAAAI